MQYLLSGKMRPKDPPLHPNCLMWALISNNKLKAGESVSSFCKQFREQGLLYVYNILHLFLASSVWLVRSLEPRLKTRSPDLPKLWLACSYTDPKEKELMCKRILCQYFMLDLKSLCLHLLQHFFFGCENWKMHFERFCSKKPRLMGLFPGWSNPSAFFSHSAFRI